MRNAVIAIGKYLFGERYKRLLQSVYVSVILFFSLSMSGFQVEIAPRFLYLTAAVFSAGIMWEALASGRNAELFAGLFVLPFDGRILSSAIVLSFSVYTLVTRTMPVLALFFAVKHWEVPDMALAVFFAAASCVITAGWYTLVFRSGERYGGKEGSAEKTAIRDGRKESLADEFRGRDEGQSKAAEGSSGKDEERCKAAEGSGGRNGRKVLPAVKSVGLMKPLAIVWETALLVVMIILTDSIRTALLMGGCLILAMLRLGWTDVYVFYQPVASAGMIRSRSSKSSKASVLRYLIRVVQFHPVYLMNSLALCVFAGIFPFLLGELKDFYCLPLGFGILCMNTPVCTMLSADPDTEQSLRALPGQPVRFAISYCAFIFLINLIQSSIYLISWQIQNGGLLWPDLLLAIMFALQGALLSAILELKKPIRDWKVEADLWHHPRKYLVPGIMILMGAVIGVWRPLQWIWAAILVLEVIGGWTLPGRALRREG